MTTKRLTGIMALLMAMASTASAETIAEMEQTQAFAEVEEAVAVAETEETQAATEQPAAVPAWINNVKLSGYGIMQYQGIDKKDAEDNSFSLRLVRMILDGKIGNDVAWRIQLQGNLNTGPGASSVYMVDMFAEWQKYQAFRVKVGQFKRAISFENPTHPVTQGWYSYAQVINALTGFGDRTGEKSSGGRDIGIQVQGDLLKVAGRNLLHYQLGVYNGEGINAKDKDNRKDIIGGAWVMPIDGLRIGAFGWTGTRVGIGEKNRYCLSAEYDKNEYTFRTEYMHSQGMGADASLGDKADGFYAFGIVPVIKSKLHAKARYNLYRADKTWGNSKTMYEVGLNYFFAKNLQLNMEYARVNERTNHDNYNFVDLQLAVKF